MSIIFIHQINTTSSRRSGAPMFMRLSKPYIFSLAWTEVLTYPSQSLHLILAQDLWSFNQLHLKFCIFRKDHMKRKKTKKETKKIQSENNTYLLLAKTHTAHGEKISDKQGSSSERTKKSLCLLQFMFQKLLPNSSEISMLFTKSEQGILSFFCQKRLVHIKINSKAKKKVRFLFHRCHKRGTSLKSSFTSSFFDVCGKK